MTGDPIAERAAELLSQVSGSPRFAAMSAGEREDWARGQAEQEYATVAYLPGGLSWANIEAAYRELAAQSPIHPFRRSDPLRPSRPETASRLGTSSATLDRACIAAGRGKHWPPRGL
jgi:hypothetical protein